MCHFKGSEPLRFTDAKRLRVCRKNQGCTGSPSFCNSSTIDGAGGEVSNSGDLVDLDDLVVRRYSEALEGTNISYMTQDAGCWMTDSDHECILDLCSTSVDYEMRPAVFNRRRVRDEACRVQQASSAR